MSYLKISQSFWEADTEPEEAPRTDILLRDASPGPREDQAEAALDEWSRWESPAARLGRIPAEGRQVPRRRGAE